MQNVSRFRIDFKDQDGWELVGDVVKASDYDTLERSLRESWASEKRLAARIAQLEAALRELREQATGGDIHFMTVRRLCDKALATPKTDCDHKWIQHAINNAKDPGDPPEYAYTPAVCRYCGKYQVSSGWLL